MNRTEPISVKQVEAAKLIGVTDQTIRNWERQGKIKGTRVGGAKLYPFADLKRLVGAK